MQLMYLDVKHLKKCVKIHYHKWLSRLPKVKSPVYNLRIHVTLSIRTSNPKFNLLRWKKTFQV